MKLIGNFLSPFARRVAISLNHLGIDYEMETIMVRKNPERVSGHNPLVRIPTLILDDGDVLVESFAILDAIDEMAGSEKALISVSGAARRQVLKITGVALGTMDKTQWAAYEVSLRPEDKVHQPWVEHNENQALGGLGYLNGLAEKSGDRTWLDGTECMSQADISAAVAFGFAKKVRPNLEVEKKFPALAAFGAHCEKLEAFAKAPIPE